MWDPVLPYFTAGYRCIALDLRAHSLSDAPMTGYHIDDMAGDVLGVMDALGVERAHVVGSSIGAEVGLSMAVNYPERMLSLVAEGAFRSEYGPYSMREVADIADDPEMRKRLEDRRASSEKTYPSRAALVEESGSFYKQHSLWNPTVESVLEYGALDIEEGCFVSAWRKHASDAYMEHYMQLRFEDYYARVICPVLMLPDEDDAKDEKTLDIMTRLSKLPN